MTDATHDEPIRPPAHLADVARSMRPTAWLLDVDVRDRQACLEVAADALAGLHTLNPVLTYDALWRREQAASTAIGAAFAVPHARLRGLARPATVFVRSRKPVPFGAPDGLPVSCILAILVPEDGDAQDHLTMLGLVARMVSNATFRARMTTASTPADAAASFDAAIADVVAAEAPDQR